VESSGSLDGWATEFQVFRNMGPFGVLMNTGFDEYGVRGMAVCKHSVMSFVQTSSWLQDKIIFTSYKFCNVAVLNVSMKSSSLHLRGA
jgi:hypothetical protein